MSVHIKQLQTKILAGTIGLVLLVGLAAVVYIRTVLYQQLMEDLEKRGILIVRTAAEESVNPLLTEKHLELELLLRDLKASEENIEYLFIVNARGEIAAHTFPGGFPTDLKMINGKANGGYRIQRLETEKGIILDFGAPLMEGKLGFAHLGMAEAPIRKNVTVIIAKLVGVIAAILIVAIGLAAGFSAAITKPVKELGVAARAVGRGDLDHKAPVRSLDEIGRLAEAFNSMIDERKRAEVVLRASEKKLRDLTSHLAEGLYVLNTAGTITFMNPEAERLLGWTLEELNAQGAHRLVHYRRPDGRSLPLEECQIHNVVRCGQSYVSRDEVFVRRDGTVFPVSVVCSPIFENGNAVASITSFRDITSRKELELEKEQLLLAYEDALNNIKTLKGLMPICASCKRIRDDKGYWNQIESYIHEHSDVEFSHGLCPECAKTLYPEYYPEEP